MKQAFCKGCGGLSEGMHQAGAANTKWAIEYWTPAADAFKLNNPDAFVYNGNCNVLLHRAMVKADAADQCDACAECIEESEQFDEEQAKQLPLPGDVEFICGGPPCQVLLLHQGVYMGEYVQLCAFLLVPVSYTHLTLPTICSV